MLILQIDASSDLCSVALSRQGNLLHMEINTEPFQHGRDINILINHVMEKCNQEFSDLHAVSINKGPGSYTALRIGMATAKGLCYGLDIPLIAPSGLEILVDRAISTCPEADLYVPMIDARRMEVYTTEPVADLNRPLDYKAQILTENSYDHLLHERICFIGNGVEKWKAIWPEGNNWTGEQVEIDAGMMTRSSQKLLESNNISDLFLTTPLYLKIPNITKSKKVYFN